MENARRFSIAQCSLPYEVFLSCYLFSSASCWTGFRFFSKRGYHNFQSDPIIVVFFLLVQ